MTSQQRGPDWYPDPGGGQGLRYWDGRQWHSDIRAEVSADERPGPPISTRPQAQRHTAVLTALSVAALILFGVIGVTGYLLVKRSHAPQSPVVAQPTPSPAPTPVTGQPTQRAPTSQYFSTPLGRTCQVTAQRAACQTCVPGEVITVAYTCTDPAPTVAVNAEGVIDENSPPMASAPDAQQLSAGQTYHASGWTIVVSVAWTRFVDDTTGRGMAVSAQNYYSI